MVQMGRLKTQMNAVDEGNPTVVSTSRLDIYSLRYRVKYLYLPLLTALKSQFIPVNSILTIYEDTITSDHSEFSFGGDANNERMV